MSVLTAGTAIKDALLWKIDEDVEDSADEEYKRNVQYIYEHSSAMLSEKAMTKKEFDETMRDCRDRGFASEVAENLRELNRLFAEGEALALKYGITEEDVNEAIREVREEMRAEWELAKK